MTALFSLAEINFGCGFHAHVFAGLKRQGLGPSPAVPAVRGGRPKWDVAALATFAVLGAAHDAVGSLALAARLAEPLVRSFTEMRGHLPINMSMYREAYNHGVKFPDGDEFERHAVLASRPDLYTPHRARDDDYSFFVVDRRFIFEGTRRPRVMLLGYERLEDSVEIQYVVDNWRWGEEAVEVHPVSRMNEEEFTKIEAEAIDAWANARALVAVNASLAIRDAFDRILQMRSEKGGEDA